MAEMASCKKKPTIENMTVLTHAIGGSRSGIHPCSAASQLAKVLKSGRGGVKGRWRLSEKVGHVMFRGEEGSEGGNRDSSGAYVGRVKYLDDLIHAAVSA